MATPPHLSPAEQYLVAFVIQGDDVFRITSDSIVQASGGASDLTFQGVAKLKAAAALEQLTSIHNERPAELRQMARELANEGMRLLARSSNAAKITIIDRAAEARGA